MPGKKGEKAKSNLILQDEGPSIFNGKSHPSAALLTRLLVFRDMSNYSFFFREKLIQEFNIIEV